MVFNMRLQNSVRSVKCFVESAMIVKMIVTLHVRLLVRRLGIVQLQNVADGESGGPGRHLHIFQQSAIKEYNNMNETLWNDALRCLHFSFHLRWRGDK